MTGENSNAQFAVHVRPVVATTVLCVGALLLLIALDGLFINAVIPAGLHVALKVLLWILLVVSLVTTIVGIKQMVRPACIFEVTEDGIVQYMRAGVALEKGQLIPWDRVDGMELSESVGYHGRSSRMIVVAVKVRSDEEWPKERLYNYDEARGCVLLDAFSGKPAGKPLLDRLARAAQALGKPA